MIKEIGINNHPAMLKWGGGIKNKIFINNLNKVSFLKHTILLILFLKNKKIF
jgi:hypothetical protein